MTHSDTPPVCDYEGSDYRTRFWEGQGRNYEDQVERIALRRLMPPTGGTHIEIGAGFGRLADEYLGYQKVVLFDYSRSLLREARRTDYRDRLAGTHGEVDLVQNHQSIVAVGYFLR